MGTLYKSIKSLCDEKGIKGGKMCVDLGISKSTMTDLKSGRRSGISLETAQKIADYFGVSVDRVLSTEQKENPTEKPGEVNTDNISELLEKMPTPDLIELLGEITETLKRRGEK